MSIRELSDGEFMRTYREVAFEFIVEQREMPRGPYTIGEYYSEFVRRGLTEEFALIQKNLMRELA